MALMLEIMAWSSLIAAAMAVPFSTRWRIGASIASVFDHKFAFVVIGILFVLAYPNDRRIVGIVCILGVAMIELIRQASPGHRFRAESAILKTLAAVTGLSIGAAMLLLVVPN